MNNFIPLVGGDVERCKTYSVDDSLVAFSLSQFFKGLSFLNDAIIIPGFTDVHVHLREPGFFYKETVKSGTMAAARGGYTTVMAMPNLNPVPDCLDNLQLELDIIKKDAVIRALPYGSITIGEKGEKLSNMEELSPFVCGFSDDGRGVASDELMLEAMLRAKKLNKIISAHTEDYRYSGGLINDCEYARANGIKGISAECEYKQIERDIRLAKISGVKYHVCHVSAKESVELIRQAKKEGVDITAETAPHYLLLDDSMLCDDGRFKMSPPIRSVADKNSLIEGIIDGTIDMIATDHAPHSLEEKSKGLKSLNGITGIECAFPVLQKGLVEGGIITLEKLIALLADNPNKRFSVDNSQDFTVFKLGNEYEINSSDFISMGKSTPFEGYSVNAECLLTVSGGRPCYVNEGIKEFLK